MRRYLLPLLLALGVTTAAAQTPVRVLSTATDPNGNACTLTSPPTVVAYNSGSDLTWYVCTSSTWSAVTAGTGTIGGTASTTDNAIVRVTGTGGLTVQGYTSNDPTISDAGAANFPGGITGALTGNADTATALASNPADCSAGNFANAIAANGDLTCGVDGSSLTGVDAATVDAIEGASLLRSDAADTGSGLYDWTGGQRWSIEGVVTKVRAYDVDGDGTLEMTDLQSILTAYGADTELVIPAGSWVAQDNESNSNGVIEITNDNVHIRCEGGAVLNGPKQYFGTHDGAANHPNLDDSTASFGTMTGYTLDNLTDGSSCTVTSNTATTATCTLTGGTDNDWDASDAYSLELDIMSAVYVSGDEFSIDGCEIDGGLPDGTATTVDLDGVSIQKHGVRLVGTDRFWVTNNYMHDLNHAGVITVSASNGIIAHNYILRSGRYGSTPVVDTTENGIQVYTDTGDSDTRNIVIQGNIVEKFTGNGIALRKQDENDTVQDIVIDGNVIIDQENGAGSCVNPFSGDGVVISNTIARNCRLHITGGTDYIANGTAGSVTSARNVLIENFNLDNSAWTATAQDIKIGQFNEGVTLRNVRVVSSGNDSCLEYDPPNRDFVVDGLTLIDCVGDGATDGAILVQNTTGTEDAGVTGREAQWRNVTIINPATPAMRNIVATTGWLFENWRVTGHSTVNAGILRFIIDSAASSRLTFRNIDLETDNTNSAVDGIEFTAANLDDSVFDGVTCRDGNGVCVHLESGGSDNYFNNVRAYHTSSGGGAIDTGTSTTPRIAAVWCENASGKCITGTDATEPVTRILKTTAETVNNSNTLQADDALVFSAEAGTYLVKYRLGYLTNATADFKYNITCPTQNAALISGHFYAANAVLVGSDSAKTSCGWAFTAVASNASEGWIEINAYLDLSASGTVTLQWAQQTATAVDTNVLVGSYVEYERLN